MNTLLKNGLGVTLTVTMVAALFAVGVVSAESGKGKRGADFEQWKTHKESMNDDLDSTRTEIKASWHDFYSDR